MGIEIAAVSNTIPPGPLEKHKEWPHRTALLKDKRQEPLSIGYCHPLFESWPWSVNSPTLQRCARCELRGLLLPLESAKSEELQVRKQRIVEKGNSQRKATSFHETVPTTKSKYESGLLMQEDYEFLRG